MKKVFIVHGFDGVPNGGWRPWLMAELKKKDAYANSLAMPNPSKPKLSQWIAEIEHQVQMNPKGQIYLVGHSLGVPAILKYIEQTSIKKIAGIVLISGPSFPTKKKAVAEFLSEPFNFALIKKKVRKIVVIHGNNDPVVSFDQAAFLAKELSGKLITVKNGGHLNERAGFTKLPQSLKALTEMF